MHNSGAGELSRLILCDPVCVLPYGHNVAAMVNFSDILGRYFDEVVRIGCRHLPEDIATARDIRREFDHYYAEDIPLSKSGNSVKFLDNHDDKVQAARDDLARLLREHHVSGRDVLCYPSIDFYALYALAESAEELRSAGSPTLLIRLIGVMETAASGVYAEPFNVMLALLGKLMASGLPVRIAAETPRYADLIAVHLDCEVAVTANIESRKQLPLPESREFTVICPGSARFDKGFLELHEIFTKVRRSDPQLRIRFKTQVLPDRDLKHHLTYLQKLHAMPGVTVLPSQVSAETLERMFAEADLVLLPYAADVYEYRGSAVLVEALCSGRQVIALEGPAFVDQIRYYSAGTVCRDLEEMANSVLDYSRQSPHLRYTKARQARQRFTTETLDNYRRWAC